MRDTNLVNALREHAEWAEGNQWETPITLCDDLAEAADQLENQNAHIAALQQEIEKLRAQNEQLREAAALVAKESAELLERRWIPVEERLPEKQGWYHVAIRDEKMKRIAVELDSYAIETAKNFGHEIGFCKDGRWNGREKVIAWMPLPEPPEVENA
mgnify:CR=1 FL=1